jgi:hypothetical protein
LLNLLRHFDDDIPQLQVNLDAIAALRLSCFPGPRQYLPKFPNIPTYMVIGVLDNNNYRSSPSQAQEDHIITTRFTDASRAWSRTVNQTVSRAATGAWNITLQPFASIAENLCSIDAHRILLTQTHALAEELPQLQTLLIRLDPHYRASGLWTTNGRVEGQRVARCPELREIRIVGHGHQTIDAGELVEFAIAAGMRRPHVRLSGCELASCTNDLQMFSEITCS